MTATPALLPDLRTTLVVAVGVSKSVWVMALIWIRGDGGLAGLTGI